MENITVYNHSDLDQHAFESGGKRHTLGAFEVRVLPSDVAQLFFAQRGKFVHSYTAVAIPKVPGERVVWLANVTGNPFEPDTRKVLVFDREKNIEVEQVVPNPIKKARPIERKLQRSQIVQDAASGDGKETVSHPPITVKLPPYSRHPCSVSIAEWLTERDARQDELMVGAIRIVREPTDYEPNDSWSQEEMLAFGEIVDQRVNWRAMFPIPAVGDTYADEARKVKIDLLNALFFKVIDERYALPPREYVRTVLADQKARKQAAQQGGKPQGNQPRA